MDNDARIDKLQEWANSSDFPALIDAYRTYNQAGTLETEQRAGVLTERGVLRPDYFERYMQELQTGVNAASRTGKPLRANYDGLDMSFLVDTLQQMMDTLSLPDQAPAGGGKSVRELFKQGKEMGKILNAYYTELAQEYSRFNRR